MNPMKNAFIFFVLFSSLLFSQSKYEQIDSLMNYCYENEIFNGTILVSDNDSMLYKKAFGKADFDKGEQLDHEYSFYLGSLSKQFTTMCIMILKERGLVDYDDKTSFLKYHNAHCCKLLR